VNGLVQELLTRSVPALIPWIRQGLIATWSLRFLNPRVRDRYIAPARPFVAVLWHQYFLLSLECIADRKVVLMSSRSRDGELSARLFRRLGHRVVRGSSSAGGARALLGLTRLVRDGYGAVMIADGPRGPARVAKLGCILAAGRSGAPLIPVGCALAPAVCLRNWDRTALPIFYSRIAIGYGDPLHVPPEAGREECEAYRERLEAGMAAVEEQCREAVAS
jgi:hypothetical protein